MRRLIAYISLTVTMIIASALTIFAPIRSLNSNLEYSSGREFTYQVRTKATNDGTTPTEAAPDGALDEIFDIMDTRMETFGVSEYQLAKEGKDIIRATASLTSDNQYNRLRVYLNYDANFTVRIAKDDETTAIASAAEMFDGVKARIEYKGPYPFIVIPLSNSQLFQDTIVSVAQRIQEEEQTQTGDGSQPELVDNAKIVLWSDFNPDTDSYAKAKDDNQMAGKLFLSFDYRSMFWGDNKQEIAVASPIDNYNEQNKYTTAQIKEATDTARYMVNVFNAGSLDYDVEFLFENRFVPATVESLLVFGEMDNIAFSSTAIALLIAFAFIFFVIGFIYRFPVIGVISSFMLTMLGTILLFNVITVEVSTSAIIGLVVVGLLAVFGSLTYLGRFRNEVYRGRTFKKAHTEASRRSSTYNLDALIISLVVGVITYFTAGPAVIGFGTVLIFGSIVGLVSILLHNNIVYWLLANNTSSQKNFGFYGIDARKVPNLLENEKPSYFGRFASNSTSGNNKLYAGFFGLALLGAIVTLSVFAGIGQTPLALQVQDANITRVYFRVSENSDITSNAEETSPEDILNSIQINGKALGLIKDGDLVSYETHDYSTKTGEGENQITTNYTYLVYNISGNFSGEEEVTYHYAPLSLNGTMPLIDALDTIVTTIDPNAIVSVNHVQKQVVAPSLNSVVLVSLITLGVTTLYLAIRFGLSRGLTNLLTGAATASVVILYFVVTRISVHPLVAIGALIAVLMVALINSVIFNYQKDIKKDSFFREKAMDEKDSLALTMSLSPLYAIYILGALGFVAFMAIVPYVMSMVYFSVVLAILVGLFATTKVNLLLIDTFSKWFTKIAKIKFSFPKSKRALHREQAKRNARGRGNEPEEALIIGIND